MLPAAGDLDERQAAPVDEAGGTSQHGVGAFHRFERHARSFANRNALPYVEDRKSTRLNSSHLVISYAVFCLKKKKKTQRLEVQCRWLLGRPSALATTAFCNGADTRRADRLAIVQPGTCVTGPRRQPCAPLHV